MGVTDLLAQTGQPDGALQLLAFVAGHPAAAYETKKRAQSLLADYTSSFPQPKDNKRHRNGELDRALLGSLDDVVRTLSDNGLHDQAELPVASAPPAVLSERELQILRLIADGLSNREIAEQLFLAVSTVKWHLGEIYRQDPRFEPYPGTRASARTQIDPYILMA